MTPEFVIGFVRQAIELTLSIALPMLLVGLGVGVFVSVIQAATQIQEMTLTFIPKLVAIFIRAAHFLPWIIGQAQYPSRSIFFSTCLTMYAELRRSGCTGGEGRPGLP